MAPANHIGASNIRVGFHFIVIALLGDWWLSAAPITNGTACSPWSGQVAYDLVNRCGAFKLVFLRPEGGALESGALFPVMLWCFRFVAVLKSALPQRFFGLLDGPAARCHMVSGRNLLQAIGLSLQIAPLCAKSSEMVLVSVSCGESGPHSNVSTGRHHGAFYGRGNPRRPSL